MTWCPCPYRNSLITSLRARKNGCFGKTATATSTAIGKPMGIVSAAATLRVPRPAGGELVQARDEKRLPSLLEIQQWPREIIEICRVEDLNAGIMVASERCLIARATSPYGIVVIVEPNTKVIDLHGVDFSAGR